MGNPKCGKSTLAEILAEEFGGVVIDDGLILRRALPILLGCDPQDPFSQEGKSKRYRFGAHEEDVRQGLGELGNYLEARYGFDIMPRRAMQLAAVEHPDAPFYIYPSVRKDQGKAYRSVGGAIVQIDRVGAGPSGNAFDEWDAGQVDVWITNSGTLHDLRDEARFLPSILASLNL